MRLLPLIVIVWATILPLLSALPYPLTGLGDFPLAYYRFSDSSSRPGVQMTDSSGKNNHAVYPSPSSLSLRSWTLGGDLQNKGIKLDSESLTTSAINLPTLSVSGGLTFAFLYERGTATRTQTLFYISGVSSSFYLHVQLVDSRLSLSSSALSDPRFSAPIIFPGKLRFISIILKPGLISLTIDGNHEFDVSTSFSWEGSFSFSTAIGLQTSDPTSALVGTLDEILLVSKDLTNQETKALFQSVSQGELVGCDGHVNIYDTFDELSNGNIDGQGDAQIGACEWATLWGSRGGKVSQKSLLFDTASSPLHATRYITSFESAASATVSVKVLDLCRVDDPSEPMNDNQGYCRAGGKFIAINLCSYDSYCITFGIATQQETYFYRLGYFDEQIFFAGSIARPMVSTFPDGIFLEIAVSEDRKVSFLAGADPSKLTLIATDVYLGNDLPLSFFNILRIIVSSSNNEPGVKMEDLRISISPEKEAPLMCDPGEYLSQKLCRSCPENSTSPIGSISKSQCVCQPGFYFEGCFGTVCDEEFIEGGFYYDDFADTTNLRLGGSASIVMGRVIRLTESQTSRSGFIFYSKPLDLFTLMDDMMVEASFSCHFSFMINGNGGPVSYNDVDGPGADGMAILFVPEIPADTELGGGIGYKGITPSVVFELDTYKNPSEGDLTGNHVGYNLNGVLRSVAQQSVTPRFNDGDIWHCWVEYDAPHNSLEIRLSTSPNRPLEATLSIYDSVARIIGGTAYVGITSATGGQYSSHHILSWDFSILTRDSCNACPSDYYKDTYGNGACTPCPYPSTTLGRWGSSDASDCICYPGYEAAISGCRLCPAETFSPDYGTTCRPCPPNSTTFGWEGFSYCYCRDGFFYNEQGLCQDINECEWTECRNGGVCHNELGSFVCICPPGWSGELCDRDINECAYRPCWNSGTCENTRGSFVCHCPAGWEGVNCELDVNECASSPTPCDSNAACNNTVGSFYCTCNPGLIGSGFECHKPVGPKLLSPSQSDIFGRYVLLKWEPEAHFNPLSNVVEVAFSPDFNFESGIKKDCGLTTQCVVDNLPPNTDMRIRIFATNQFGTSPSSNVIGVKTTPTFPDAPIGTFVPPSTITWKAGNSNGAKVLGFDLQFFQADTINTTVYQSTQANETSLDLTGILKPLKIYLATITARSDFGTSSPSEVIKVEIQENQPTIMPTSEPTIVPTMPMKKSNGGLIAGVIIGVVVVLALLYGGVYYYRKRSTNGRIRLEEEPNPKRKSKRNQELTTPSEGKPLNPSQVVEGDIVQEGFVDDDAEELGNDN